MTMTIPPPQTTIKSHRGRGRPLNPEEVEERKVQLQQWLELRQTYGNSHAARMVTMCDGTLLIFANAIGVPVPPLDRRLTNQRRLAGLAARAKS